jgi:hypothetical protein
LGYRFRLQTKKAQDFGKVIFISHSLSLIYDGAHLLQVRCGAGAFEAGAYFRKWLAGKTRISAS